MVSALRSFIDYKELIALRENSRIVTIGNFDGVHLGHQAVLAQARKEADELGLELAVLTFEPHPVELLRPDIPTKRLIEPERKTALLDALGADVVLAQRFEENFADLSAERFAADVLVRALAAMVVVNDQFRVINCTPTRLQRPGDEIDIFATVFLPGTQRDVKAADGVKNRPPDGKICTLQRTGSHCGPRFVMSMPFTQLAAI